MGQVSSIDAGRIDTFGPFPCFDGGGEWRQQLEWNVYQLYLDMTYATWYPDAVFLKHLIWSIGAERIIKKRPLHANQS